MNKLMRFVGFIVLFLISIHVRAASVSAACNWTIGSGAITAVTCGVDGQSVEGYDYSAGSDDATNGVTLTVPAGVTVTLNGGASNARTELWVGRISTPETVGQNGSGIIVASGNYVSIRTGVKCYVRDADNDLYSPNANGCSATGGTGYIRRNKVTATTADCYDNNPNAKPGQTNYYTAYRGQTSTGALSTDNTASGNSFDFNCDSASPDTKQYPTATYSCGACTNGSGYASYQNTTNGFLTTVPNCGASGTYYTVTNSTCRDPAVANCSTSVSTSTVTQACR
jgi:hypothetical protein